MLLRGFWRTYQKTLRLGADKNTRATNRPTELCTTLYNPLHSTTVQRHNVPHQRCVYLLCHTAHVLTPPASLCLIRVFLSLALKLVRVARQKYGTGLQ